jgi:SNF2 family DNA or RNA helicase
LKEVPEHLENRAKLNSAEYEFRYPPFLHQSLSIEYMLHFNRLALVLGMGLGKTYICLHYLDITKKKGLVFGPVIVLDTWANEAVKFTGLKPVIYRGTAKQRAKLRESILHGDNQDWDLIITNFEGPVPKKNNAEDYKFFMSLAYDCVIIDEAQKLLGHKATRGKVVNEVASRAGSRYLLSGTLSKGKPTDIFTPVKIMDSTILGDNYWKFKNQYCTVAPHNKHIITGYKNLNILKAKLDPYMLSKTLEECVDMPPRTFVREHYSLTQPQAKIYEAIRDEERIYLTKTTPPKLVGPGDIPQLKDKAIEVGEVRCHLKIIKLNKLRQVLSGFIILSPERDMELCNTCPKILACMGLLEPDEDDPSPPTDKEIFPWDIECVKYDSENPVRKPSREVLYFKDNPKITLLSELLNSLGVNEDSKEKCLIWAEYKEDLKAIENLLQENKISFVTPTTAQCEKKFQEDPNILVFVGQVSKGIGLTLTKAKITINYSFSLELEHRVQSLDRNYRIGQNKKVLVKDMAAPHSVEMGVLTMLDKKEDVRQFMQTKNVCTSCPHTMPCMEQAIAAYTEGCVHYEARQRAEKKEAIKIE